MLYQTRLSRGYSLLPLGLAILTSCLMIAPPPAQAVDDRSLVRESGVGVDWEDSEKRTKTLVESGESSLLLTNTEHRTLEVNQRIHSLVSEAKQETDHVLPKPRSQENLSSPLPVSTFSLAQIPTFPQDTDIPPKRSSDPLPELQPPSPSPAPQPVLPSSPPPRPTKPPSPTTAEPAPGDVPAEITIEQFEFEGNTVISDQELTEATKNYINRPLSFAQVYEVRSIITKLYQERGYVTSGAIIPPQRFSQVNKVVKIQILEGGLEAIEVRGTQRLNPEYIRSRLIDAAGTPVNQKALIEALQLLQFDPLIKNLSAELTAGTQQGSSLLIVTVAEAKTLHLDLSLNNNRSPTIGTFERRLDFTQANLRGLGDRLNIGFSNTDGSNTLDATYTYPLNPRNGTLSFSTSITLSHVVESPFNRVDIDADSRYFGLTWRQPLQRTLSQEFAIGLSLTNQKSKVTIFDVPVRLSPGAEEDGSTTVTALRFFQEWTNTSGRHVFGVRSQFNLGLGLLGGTNNEDAPDSNFLAWRGQVQWVELLAPDTLFVLGGDLQVSLSPLLNLEKFGLGGRDTVRGYRQNILLSDSGASASAELRVPILRLPRQSALLQVVPFIDVGFAWNNSDNLSDPEPDPNFLASIGLGFRFQMGDRLSARLDWGIPLIGTDIQSEDESLQENGLYFSVIYRIF